MADIVIRGLDMPRPIAGEAGYVDFRIFSDGTAVMASAKPPYYKQFEAVALPEGHGRLKDSTEIIGKIKEKYCGACLCPSTSFNCQLCKITKVIEIIENAPTIVPAKGGGEDGDV